MSIPTAWLIDVIVVQSVIFIGAAVALVIHAIWLHRRDRVDAALLSQARPALAAAIALDEGVPAQVAHLPNRLRERLCLEVARSVTGGHRQRLADLVAQLGIRAKAERHLRSRRWWRRLHGVHLLARIWDAEAGLAPGLDDRNPIVRAEVIMWAGDNVDPALADRLVTSLADPSPLCRLVAADALLRAGTNAAVSIARRLDVVEDPSLVVLLHIAGSRPDPRYEAAALATATDARPEVRAEAARLLSAIGGPAAIEVLTALLTDEEVSVRAAAATGIGNLGHWPATPAVARLLRDRSWDVRRAAGEALADLGAPGTLLLQRYTDDDDPFASDMATRVLHTAQLQALEKEVSI